MRLPCTGVILAGGQATRFGGVPKGLARVHGERIIDRVAGALRESADDLLLVANDAAAASWLPGVRVECDLRPGLGSLGGLHSALPRFAVSVEPHPSALAVTLPDRPEESGRWSLVDVRVGSGYAGALAVEGSLRTRFYRWTA